MNRQIFYVCDICGEKFTKESECRQHEFEHKSSKWSKKIRFFKKNCGKMVELPISLNSIDAVEYIYCADEEAWDFLSEMFDETGYRGPDENCEYGSKFYACDSDSYTWYDVVQQMNKCHEILDSMNQNIGEDE